MTKKKRFIIYIGVIHSKDSLFGRMVPVVGSFDTKKGVAKFLGVHHNTITRWIKSGTLDNGDKSLIITTLNNNDYENINV
jgi:ribosomal protein S16